VDQMIEELLDSNLSMEIPREVAWAPAARWPRLAGVLL
jgi:hypothetical protein